MKKAQNILTFLLPVLVVLCWLSMLIVAISKSTAVATVLIYFMFALLIAVTLSFIWAIIHAIQEEPAPLVAGEVVQLNSGGPKMVLMDYNECMGWECSYFDNQGFRQTVSFQPALLKRA